ncbi:MAG: hypothetical protein LBU88_09510 [Treponema sp.]|jgi:hypothetical protein|nr:hypothetical protein [Treponema sp.]
MSGGGKGGNNRKNKYKFSKQLKKTENLLTDGKFEKNKISLHDSPRWTAPELPPVSPITTPDCKWCGKQITDITTAICDKDGGQPVHFDCVLARITETEHLETNDAICYIGGGRFGVVHYNNPQDKRDFSIKRILEWEAKETNVNSDWRKPISEYFSLT